MRRPQQPKAVEGGPEGSRAPGATHHSRDGERLVAARPTGAAGRRLAAATATGRRLPASTPTRPTGGLAVGNGAGIPAESVIPASEAARALTAGLALLNGRAGAEARAVVPILALDDGGLDGRRGCQGRPMGCILGHARIPTVHALLAGEGIVAIAAILALSLTAGSVPAGRGARARTSAARGRSAAGAIGAACARGHSAARASVTPSRGGRGRRPAPGPC